MFNFDEKTFYPIGKEGAGTFPPEKPRFTFTEEVEHTAREMHETIARLLAFEKRVEVKFDDLMKRLTSDNVVFKDTFATSHRSFLDAVKNEVNEFETSVDSAMTLFRDTLSSDYANLSEKCAEQIREYYQSFTDDLAGYKTELNDTYDNFRKAIEARIDQHNDTTTSAIADFTAGVNLKISEVEKSLNNSYSTFTAQVNNTITNFKNTINNKIDAKFFEQDSKVNDAVLYMKTNINNSVNELMRSMIDDGTINGVLESDLFLTPEMFGAVGDGVTDDTTALQNCIKSNAFVMLRGTYRITGRILFDGVENVTITGGKIARDKDRLFNTFCGEKCSNVHIVGIEFDGNGNSRTSTYTWRDNAQAAIVIDGGCKNIFIERCSFTNFNYGVFTLGADLDGKQSVNGSIVNCHFDNCHSAVDTYGKGLNISGNVFTNITENALQIEAEGEPVNGDLLNDTDFFQSGTGVKISGNAFLNVAGTAIIIHDNANGVHIDGNTIIDFGYAINACRNTWGCIVSDNTIIKQKEILVSADKRPWDLSYFAIYCGENTHVRGNYIRGAYVGIMCREKSMVCDNEIIAPIVSGIVASSNDTNNPVMMRGNKIKAHTKNADAWWGALAIVLNSGSHMIADCVVESDNEPVHNSGGVAIVYNLVSNVAQTTAIERMATNTYSN